MRVTPYATSLNPFPAAGARRIAELLVEPVDSLPERYTQHRPDTPGRARVIEGEVLPRARPDDALLNAYRARVLHGQAQPVAPPAAAADTSGLLPSTVVFYTLHSSAETLFAEPAGRHVNRYV